MKNIRKQSIKYLMVSSLLSALIFGGEETKNAHLPIHSFTTGGAPVYQLRPGTVDTGGRRSIISVTYNGTVQCHRPDGKLLWKTPTGGFFPNDLDVSDLDNDGLDESLIASADGTLYVLDHNGGLRWKFSANAPLLNACVVQSGTSKVILTGGVERKIYALTVEGKVANTYIAEHLVRFIRKGNILGTGKEYAAVVFARTVRGRDSYFLQVFDPANLTPIWEKNVNIARDNLRACYFDLLTADINKDGADDIILSHGWRDNGKLSAYDKHGDKIPLPEYQWRGITSPTYRMNRIVHVRSPSLQDEYLLGLFGNQIITYNLDLTMREVSTTAFSYANGAFDPVTNTYYMGSSISGGDCIHAIDLSDIQWGKAYENLKPAGNLARILSNVSRLNHDIENFQQPAYQPKPVPLQIITGSSAASEMSSLTSTSFVALTSFHESYDRSVLPGIWKTKKETRFQYNDTQEEILQYAKTREEKKQTFALWAGHGNDPFYMQLATIEGILRSAPSTFEAFVFPEMERTDEAMVQAVKERVIPLAELCRQYGKKIILRNKNMYWFGSCYMELWHEPLLSGRYRDVFVPSMEETGDLVQDLSLSGRVGLWMTGYFNQYCARAVTDNACYSRIWEWCSQQVLTHLIRAMALEASLGADMFMINTYQGDSKQMNLLYRMLDKGVIHIPARNDILSISDVCIGIRKPSKDFIEHGANGWNISRYQPEERTYVFGRLDCFWGGAPVLPHDFSYYGTGSRSRMLNFLPRNPYGLVAFVPDELDLSQHPRLTRKISTDGEYFYDEQGIRHTAEEYRPVVEGHLQAAARRMPILVEGEVSWSAARIDPRHIRLVVIDAGYLDPSDRSAVIIFQNIRALECRDILSNEQLAFANNTMKLTVPAGILRIVDITHE